MKLSDLRKMSVAELNEELTSVLREQFNLRMLVGTDQATRPHLVKEARRNVARIKTIFREKEKMGVNNE